MSAELTSRVSIFIEHSIGYHFFALAQAAYASLLLRGQQQLAELERSSGLTYQWTRKAALVLLQHNLAVAYKVAPETGPPHCIYRASVAAALHFMRCGRQSWRCCLALPALNLDERFLRTLVFAMCAACAAAEHTLCSAGCPGGAVSVQGSTSHLTSAIMPAGNLTWRGWWRRTRRTRTSWYQACVSRLLRRACTELVAAAAGQFAQNAVANSGVFNIFSFLRTPPA